MNYITLSQHCLVRNELLVLDPKKQPVMAGVVIDVAEELARAAGTQMLAEFGGEALLIAKPASGPDQGSTKFTLEVVVARKLDHDEFMRLIGEAKRQQYSNGYAAGVAAGVEMGKSIAAARLAAILEAPGDA